MQLFQTLIDRVKLFSVPVKSNPTEARHSAQEPVSSQSLVQTQHFFFEPHRVRVANYKSNIGRNCPNICHMVVKPLQFQADGAKCASPSRCFDVARSFDRMAKRGRMSETRISGNALCQSYSVSYGDIFEQFLGSFVG